VRSCTEVELRYGRRGSDKEDQMLRSTTYFGISMVSRKNRRLLVIGTYVVLILGILSFVAIPWTHVYVPVALAWVLIISVHLSARLFHSVVSPAASSAPKLILLGLGRKRRSGDPDERDIGVRRAAEAVAYELVAVYAFLVCLYAVFSFVKLVPLLLLLPIGVFAPTLPQAVLLWTEADVPEEART
jgi:fatty acid desaturase